LYMQKRKKRPETKGKLFTGCRQREPGGGGVGKKAILKFIWKEDSHSKTDFNNAAGTRLGLKKQQGKTEVKRRVHHHYKKKRVLPGPERTGG